MGLPDISFLAGQRLMVGFEGLEFNSDLEYLIHDLHIGGLILFAINIESPAQVTTLCTRVQEFAGKCKLPPLFVSVDQEGGVVARFKEPLTVFKGNPFIHTLEQADVFGRIVSEELRRMGVNMNLAPVMDVAFEPDSIMIDRAFKGDSSTVSELGVRMIRTMQTNKVMAVAKHFPGIGRTIADSHFELPVLETEYKTMMNSDVLPFIAAGKAGVAGMMLSHILYRKLDPVWPASLSPAIAKHLLRDRLGYQGVVMTDDLDMKAIRYDIRTCIRQILRSHIDMVLICHKGPDIQAAYDEILRQISAQPDMLEAAEESYHRILTLKKQFLA